jgi:hypothetical protein
MAKTGPLATGRALLARDSRGLVEYECPALRVEHIQVQTKRHNHAKDQARQQQAISSVSRHIGKKINAADF